MSEVRRGENVVYTELEAVLFSFKSTICVSPQEGVGVDVVNTYSSCGSWSCIVSCMDYAVRAFDLTDDEMKDLRLILGTNAKTVGLIKEPDDAHNALPLVWVPVEFGLKHSGSVLLPVAGAIGKSALDVPVDRVKEWLATRPGNRRVEIYGPDYKVVRIVKKGTEIRTSSAEFSKDPRR